MQCFCGCDRKVSFGLRATNKRGQRLRRDVRQMERFLEIGLVSPNATTFVEQANLWCEGFAEAVHLRIKPDDDTPDSSQIYLGWLKMVKPFVNVPLIGKMVRDAGLSSEEAVALMSRGELDLWADVEMPVADLDAQNPAEWGQFRSSFPSVLLP